MTLPLHWPRAFLLPGVLRAAMLLAGADTDGTAVTVIPDNGPRPTVNETTEREDSDSANHLLLVDPESGESLTLTQQAQPQPIAPAPQPLQPAPAAPAASEEFAASVFGTGTIGRSLLSQTRQGRAQGPATDVVLGAESRFRATTDAGSLLGKSTATVGTATHKRSPIVTDPRIHGSSIGQLLASGSYWFPARMDLDTILSKIDSRDIRDMIIIKGPYSALYGPGFDFIDVQLLESPRFQDGFEGHGSTSVDYKTNGQQWYGRQSVWAGDSDWGIRVGYGHRTGNDYHDGDGDGFPTSYKSRDLNVALGMDLSANEHIEFNYLRLDQTDVELPGQVVDLNFLVTDSYEVKYLVDHQCYFDTFTAEAWYNRTRFEGDANSTGKRLQLPFLAFFQVNESDGNNMSTGFKLAVGWGETGDCQTTFGVDLRYLTQELNQFSSTDVFGPFPGFDFNQPIPSAHSANPGIFAQQTNPVTDRLVLNVGGRLDWVETNAAKTVPETADQAPFGFPPLNIPPIVTNDLEVALGGGHFDRSLMLGSAFLSAAYEINSCLTATAGGAFAMRPPTMTELYSIGTFATAMPQLTVSALIGNPRLNAEKRYQLDAGLKTETGRFRGAVGGFYAWIQDYITFDRIAPDGFFLAYTNTDLATLAGIDVAGEYKVNCWLDTFGMMSYVEGRDHTRDGNAIPANRYRAADSPRSGVASEEEPLPVIAPLETRLGVRFHEPCPAPAWGVELSSRIVSDQDRVASSLGELPTDSFTTVDLRGYWRVTKSLTCLAGVENLTNQNYQEHFDSHGQPVNQPVPLNPGVVVPAGSTLSVLQPGVTFYFGMELVY